MDIVALVELRFAERDKEFAKMVTALMQEMNAKGKLHSGDTIVRGHEILIREYSGSRQTIVETCLELARLEARVPEDSDLLPTALMLLSTRQENLDSNYRSRMKVVFDSLSNKRMIEDYIDLVPVSGLANRELEIALQSGLKAMREASGATLLDRVRNSFYNNPIVVICLVVISWWPVF